MSTGAGSRQRPDFDTAVRQPLQSALHLNYTSKQTLKNKNLSIRNKNEDIFKDAFLSNFYFTIGAGFQSSLNQLISWFVTFLTKS